MSIASKANVAKVIATSFVPRVVRETTQLAGEPLGYFSHSQNFPTEDSVIGLLEFTLERESKCDPGVPVDLLIVNNDTGWEKGRVFLEKIDGKVIRSGTVRVVNRANYGRSFGAYNHAFAVFGNEYDYFIFTEDDILVARDGYASIAIDTFRETARCGFVAYQGLSRKSLDLGPEDSFAAHGGVGLSSSQILHEVAKRYGCLPHCDEQSPQGYFDIIRGGEVAFTNKIHRLGYRLASIPRGIKLYDFAYDVMRGIEVSRYASLPERLLHKLKNEMYKRESVRAIHQAYKSAFCK